MTDELQRQININLQLRRQLEKSRRDTVEYCAKYCEDMNPMSILPFGKWYAKRLREIIGK